jgi:cytochrome d ubiquinol oxidase subunit II
VLICTQGASWLSMKIEVGSQMRERAVKWRRINIVLSIVLFAVVTLYTLAIIQPASLPGMKAVSTVLAALVFAALVFALVRGSSSLSEGGDKRDLGVFLATSAACLLLVFVWAFGMFPTLVPATGGDPLAFFPTPASGIDITVANSASSDTALTAMLVIACIGIPLVLIYHFIVYRTFRGRIPVEEQEY